MVALSRVYRNAFIEISLALLYVALCGLFVPKIVEFYTCRQKSEVVSFNFAYSVYSVPSHC